MLDVSPQALDVPDIDSQIGLMHTLFTLEDVYGLTVSEADGEVCLKVNKDKGKEAYELLQMPHAWKEQADKLSAGEISKDDYDRWRYYYPKIRHHAALGESAFTGVKQYAGGGVSGQAQKRRIRTTKSP